MPTKQELLDELRLLESPEGLDFARFLGIYSASQLNAYLEALHQQLAKLETPEPTPTPIVNPQPIKLNAKISSLPNKVVSSRKRFPRL